MNEPLDQESRRQNALREYQIMDTAPEQDFDEITQIASQICGTPISLITLLDEQRQWFKSHHGLDTTETPREQAFCAHAIQQPDQIMIVENPTEDPRFRDNPLVTGDLHIRFYAGAPLVNAEGLSLGTLCVIDQQPHSLTEQQVAALKALANQAMAQMELRKKVQELKEANEDMSEYAQIVSHDLKSPVNTLISLVNLFKLGYASQIDAKGLNLISLMEQRAEHLKNLIEGVLEYCLLERGEDSREWVNLNTLIPQIIDDLLPDEEVEIALSDHYPTLWINQTYVQQIFQNLLTNAIKYNDKKTVKIEITARMLSSAAWEFTVSDNGLGIEEGFISRIFEPFQTLRSKDRFGKVGSGIGLATVKKVISRLGGEIRVESVPQEGCKFIFTLVGNTWQS